MHTRFLLILVLSLVVVVLPAFAEDRTAQRVEQAEERFEKAVYRVAEKIEAALDKEIEEAREEGKLDLLVALQEQKQLYEGKELIPRHPAVSSASKSYYKTLDREGDKLFKIYDRAVEDYTKSDQLDAAKDIQGRIEWLRPLSTLKTIEFENHRYLLIEATIPWHEAQKKCIELGGYLGCVNSEKENKLFYYMKGDHRVIWLGLTDEAKEGFWQWVDGSPVKYENWAPGEPNGSKPHSAAVLFNQGVWDDVGPGWGEVRAFVCEWDHEITRRSLKNTSGTDLNDAPEIEVLKLATVKHNQLIVRERKKLQAAIVEADLEKEIVDAKDDYNRQVSTIKQNYVDQLQDVLDKAIVGDRLQIASKIKTQMLRVKSQIEKLSREDTGPNVPAIDSGNEDATTPDPRPSDSGGNEPTDGSSGDDGGGPDFFGIPLE